MADDIKINADGSAEKAYATAAEAVTAKPFAAEAPKPVPVIEVIRPEVEFPSKAKRTPKPQAEAAIAAASPGPAAMKPATAGKAKLAKVAKVASKKAKPVAVKAPAVIRKPQPVVKPAVAAKPKALASTAKAAIQPQAA